MLITVFYATWREYKNVAHQLEFFTSFQINIFVSLCKHICFKVWIQSIVIIIECKWARSSYLDLHLLIANQVVKFHTNDYI